MVQAKNLSKYPELLHYFGDKQDSANLEKLGIKMDNIIMGEQIHDCRLTIVNDGKIKLIKGIDGLITQKPLLMGIRTADCLPIFFYDPKNKIIAAIHAGWKGLSRGIIDNAIKMMKKLESNTGDLKVAIGPHIHVCCYKVRKERIEKFSITNTSDRLHLSSNHFYKMKSKSYYLNLSNIALFQFKSLGIADSDIDISDICTSCDNNYWSYRRDKEKSGRMINFIGLN